MPTLPAAMSWIVLMYICGAKEVYASLGTYPSYMFLRPANFPNKIFLTRFFKFNLYKLYHLLSLLVLRMRFILNDYLCARKSHFLNHPAQTSFFSVWESQCVQ